MSKEAWIHGERLLILLSPGTDAFVDDSPRGAVKES